MGVEIYFRVLSVVYEENRLSRVRLMFLDQDSETVRRIQGWVAYNMFKQKSTGT